MLSPLWALKVLNYNCRELEDVCIAHCSACSLHPLRYAAHTLHAVMGDGLAPLHPTLQAWCTQDMLEPSRSDAVK
jgi:hypothetical protein